MEKRVQGAKTTWEKGLRGGREYCGAGTTGEQRLQDRGPRTTEDQGLQGRRDYSGAGITGEQ